jgi:hypothetical protein
MLHLRGLHIGAGGGVTGGLLPASRVVELLEPASLAVELLEPASCVLAAGVVAAGGLVFGVLDVPAS